MICEKDELLNRYLKENDPTIAQCKHYAIYELLINLPIREQFSRSHPNLVKRLVKDWGGGLSALSCSSGDFLTHLKSGQATIGHVSAEIFCLMLDKITVQFDEWGMVKFAERVKMIRPKKANEPCVYKIHIFFEEVFPPEFNSLIFIMIGYMNSLLEDRDFAIHDRLKGFVKHRSLSE